jgi:hypothetical protein
MPKAQFTLGASSRFNAGLSKKLSPRTTIKFNVNDMFHTAKGSGVINNLAQTYANWRNVEDSRFASLSLSYRFGKAIADQRKHVATGAESEQNRVKN